MVKLKDSDSYSAKNQNSYKSQHRNEKDGRGYDAPSSRGHQGKLLKPLSGVNNVKSIIQKKPEKLPVFELIGKYFKKVITSYNQAELKSIHSKILDELTEMRDSFLNLYREYIDMMKGNVRLEKDELDQFEEQSISVEGYIQGVTSVLENEKDMTNMVRENLHALRKFMQEELVFSERFIVEKERKEQEKEKNVSSKNFYQMNSASNVAGKNKQKVESDDSLLLDDD